MVKIFLANLNEISEPGQKKVDFGGRPVVIIRYKGKVIAYLDICTHLGGPMNLEDDYLRCEWHDSKFDPLSGRAKTGPASPNYPLIRLPIKIENGKIYYVYGES